jgi:hypothetical protein
METQGATGLLLSRTEAMEEAEEVVRAVVKEEVAEAVVDVVEEAEAVAVRTRVAVVIRTPPGLEVTIGRWRRWVLYR